MPGGIPPGRPGTPGKNHRDVPQERHLYAICKMGLKQKQKTSNDGEMESKGYCCENQENRLYFSIGDFLFCRKISWVFLQNRKDEKECEGIEWVCI